jgi:outer membrane protein assembly factor BamB
MLMRDAANSGYTPQGLNTSGVHHLQWKFSFGERVEVQVQPVVAGGRVYVGVMNGKMYCLNAANGAQQWVYQAGGPIPHTAAVADGRVFFGSLDGKVYALDAASGAVRWTYTTGGPVYSAPAVVDGTVFIGSVDGHLYALNAENGQLRWRYATGGRVLTSPAVAGGRVYFGSEDMHAYAVRASDGGLAWRTRLQGAGMINTYPVVSEAANTVIFVTVKPGRQSYVPEENYPNVSASADIRSTWRAFYRSYPARRHLYFLNATTGADRWNGENDRYQPLPLPYWGLIIPVLDASGHAWFPSPSGASGYQHDLNHDFRLMSINLNDGVITQRASYNDYQLRHDETGRPTMLGNRYYYTISEDVGWYDIQARTKLAVFGNGYPSHMYNFGSHMDPLDVLPTKNVWRYGGAITIGGVPNSSPLIAAGGRGYYVSYGWLYCLGTSAANPPAVTPRSDLYTGQAPWPTPSITDVRNELVSRVQQIIAAGRVPPSARWIQPQTYMLRGQSHPFQTFWHEGERIRTVAEALPYLPDDVSQQARAYLRTQVQSHLLSANSYQYRQDSLSYDGGISTQWYADNENLVAERLYALWAYGHYTGDWALLQSNWSFIRQLFNDRLSNRYVAYGNGRGFCRFEPWHVGELLDLNQQIGGTAAVSYMAARFGDTQTRNRAEQMLSGMKNSRLDLERYVRTLYDSGQLQPVTIRVHPDGRLVNEDVMRNYNDGNETIPYGEVRDRERDIRKVIWWDGGSNIRYNCTLGHGQYAVLWGYTPMYPEVAELLRNHRLEDARQYVRSFTMNDPWWWLNDLSHSKVGGGEHLYETPALSHSIFQTKAYVLNESGAELLRQLPLEYTNAGYRDLYRLQNLIAILRTRTPSTKTASPGIVEQGEQAEYSISVVGSDSAVTIEAPIPAGTAYVGGSAGVQPQIGSVDANSTRVRWTGTVPAGTTLVLRYRVSITVSTPTLIRSQASVSVAGDGENLSTSIIANGFRSRLPMILKGS